MYYAAGRQSSSGSAAVREKSSSSSDSSSQQSASASLDEKSFDQKKDVVNYRKLIEYQPQNPQAAEVSLTYTAIVREALKYGLRLLDNDTFRSEYFRGKPMTLQEMQNSSELARYVRAARDAKADYFMVGNTLIQDEGKKGSLYTCTGQVTIKAYSTEDRTLLTSDTRAESSNGSNANECRGNVANKLAGFVGGTVGSAIKDYMRQREVSGREYSIELVSNMGNLSGRVTSSFNRAISSIKGINSKLNVRKNSNKEYELSVTYKGDNPLADNLEAAFDAAPSLKTADWVVNGTTIKVCLEGKCI
jgi:ketosteroid isomerase-like protein